MTEPGEQRPPQSTAPTRPRRSQIGVLERLRPSSLGVAIVEAVLVGLLAAVVWALLKGILELGVGLLAVAAIGGWAIGAILWQVRAHIVIAPIIAALAWLAGLVLTWVVAMAKFQDSVRTFFERLGGTPFHAPGSFVDWLSPQFGPLEIAGLGLYVVAALYGARPSR